MFLRISGQIKKTLLVFVLILLAGCNNGEKIFTTEIAKWQNDKNGAVTLTFDDGTINQFRIAIPLMDQLSLPGTFYLITGTIPESNFKGQFVGRNVDEIIAETAEVPTNEDNFFERASAIRYLGYQDVHQYHREAGQLFERGDIQAAHAAIDEGYERVRNGDFESGGKIEEYSHSFLFREPETEFITWEELQSLHRNGFHEFGSHTITHPYLAVLDEENILHELKRSKEDIEHFLGPEHTFSVEGPFGTEDERVMPYLFEVYPAARNRMPESWLEELNRGSDLNPAEFDTEYVQWQRGPREDTPVEVMKSWVNKVEENENIWLVLVFHGIEGIGWEPVDESTLEEYFNYINDIRDDLWVATFKDVTKYVHQRMNAEVETREQNDEEILVTVTHSLDEIYDLPLTLKTYLPQDWENVLVYQGEDQIEASFKEDVTGKFVSYQAEPNTQPLIIYRD